MSEKLALVRFNNVGKSYYFSTDIDLEKGDKVVVETIRGLELGEIVTELKDLSEFNLDTELKKIKSNKEISKLNYLYEEFFSKENLDFATKIDKLKLEIEKDYNDFHNKLYSLLKLTTIKKK